VPGVIMEFLNGVCQKLIAEIREIRRANYSDGSTDFIESVFKDILDLYNGKRKGFQRADTRYHDVTHTLQTIPPFLEIIDGWNKAGNQPFISNAFFDLGVVAVLLHDAGYIKKDGDNLGTGAKFTFVHIQRSAEFAEQYLLERGIGRSQISSAQKAIRCTGILFGPQVSFDSDEERIIGYALGTADLLGQMSSPDYVLNLPILYDEFVEAYNHEGAEKLQRMGIRVFESAEDLIKSTPFFYEHIALGRFKTMHSVHNCINIRYEDRKNPYIEAIEANIKSIRTRFPEA
jgi:hypothetical protein